MAALAAIGVVALAAVSWAVGLGGRPAADPPSRRPETTTTLALARDHGDSAWGSRTAASGDSAMAAGAGLAHDEWPGLAVEVGVKLILVLGLAYGGLALLRRFGPGAAWRPSTSRLRVLESTSLAPNRTIVLVRAGERELLLGVTPTQITALAEWDADSDHATGNLGPSFAALLSSGEGDRPG